MSAVLQYVLYLAILVILAIPLGAYIKKAMCGEKTFLSKILTPCENAIYKIMRIDKDEQMNWEKICALRRIFFAVWLYLSVFAAAAAGGASRQPAEPAGSFLAFVL